MEQSFGKLQRLKSKKTIDRLFLEGKSIKNYPFKLIYIPADHKGQPLLQTAVSVPKKLVKTAVQRNRIKRVMREIFRKNKYLVQSDLSSPYAIMIIHLAREEMSHAKLCKSMIGLLDKFNKTLKAHEK